ASLNVTFSLLLGSAPKIFARDLVKSNTWPAPLLVWRIIVHKKNPINNNGKIPYSKAGKSHDQTGSFTGLAEISTFCNLVLSTPKLARTSGNTEFDSFIDSAVLSSV